ncbi:MAG: DNA-3-methyladenine glycosylase [Ignavibacteria bacterium]|nr:DNA-3-methyladenine glycosylase [Ignavibacteria bacterium]
MNFEINFNKRLEKDFFMQATEIVARNLIGKVLVRNINGTYVAAMIVEAEAYLAENDLASHSAVGITNRNRPMFEDGGTIYVYKIYGVHHCVNIVTESKGKGCAVLIRAGEPIFGIEIFRQFRNHINSNKILSGPGNFAKGFNFTLSDNFKTLFTPELFVQDFLHFDEKEIGASPRIGIVKSTDLLLRFYLKNCKSVSAKPKD